VHFAVIPPATWASIAVTVSFDSASFFAFFFMSSPVVAKE
jgi:hypothetical protein